MMTPKDMERAAAQRAAALQAQGEGGQLIQTPTEQLQHHELRLMQLMTAVQAEMMAVFDLNNGMPAVWGAAAVVRHQELGNHLQACVAIVGQRIEHGMIADERSAQDAAQAEAELASEPPPAEPDPVMSEQEMELAGVAPPAEVSQTPEERVAAAMEAQKAVEAKRRAEDEAAAAEPQPELAEPTAPEPTADLNLAPDDMPL